MSDLVSKVLAGGLTAGIFLLWWPSHVPVAGAEWLIARGLLWTLAFEVLLLSFCPLERAIARAVRGRGRSAGAPRALARPIVLAALGLGVPGALLHGASAEIAAPARAAAPQKVIVKREIVRREIVVRQVSRIVRVRVPSSNTVPAATAVTPPVRRTTTVAPKPVTKARAPAQPAPKATMPAKRTAPGALASPATSRPATPVAQPDTATPPAGARAPKAAAPSAPAQGAAGTQTVPTAAPAGAVAAARP